MGLAGAERSARVVLLSPQGDRLDQAGRARLAALEHLVLVCGRYEVVDQRAIELAVTPWPATSMARWRMKLMAPPLPAP